VVVLFADRLHEPKTAIQTDKRLKDKILEFILLMLVISINKSQNSVYHIGQ